MLHIPWAFGSWLTSLVTTLAQSNTTTLRSTPSIGPSTITLIATSMTGTTSGKLKIAAWLAYQISTRATLMFVNSSRTGSRTLSRLTTSTASVSTQSLRFPRTSGRSSVHLLVSSRWASASTAMTLTSVPTKTTSPHSSTTPCTTPSEMCGCTEKA